MRLSQIARELNVGISTIVDHLAKKGHTIDNKPNTKVSDEQVQILTREFKSSALEKEEASEVVIGGHQNKNVIIESDASESANQSRNEAIKEEELTIKNVGSAKETEGLTSKVKLEGIKVVGKIDLNNPKGNKPAVEEPKKEPAPTTPTQETPKVSTPVEPKKEEPKIETPVSTPKVEEVKKEAPIEAKKEEPKKEEPKKEQAPVEELKKEAPVEAKKIEEPKATIAPEKVEQTPVTTPKKEEAPVEAKKQEESKAIIEPTKPIAEIKQPLTPKIESNLIEAKADALKGLTVLGKIELPAEKKKEQPVASSDIDNKKRKRKRVRIDKGGEKQGSGSGSQGQGGNNQKGGGNAATTTPQAKEPRVRGTGAGAPGNAANRKPGGGGGDFKRGGKRTPEKPAEQKAEISEKEIQEKIKATMARIEGGTNKNFGNRAKYRKEKREAMAEAREEKMLQEQEEAKTLKVTEFVSANDLANLIGISVNEIISLCMSLGMFVSINQRLDAEAISLIAEEFGYKVDFSSADADEEEEEEEIEDESLLVERAPIVTIMGHVDHGKTSLLDYIRSAKVAEGEAGGITQHIGAYSVKTDSGKKVTFLDTPGHEAFTAMRARGAKVTDIVILVVAADDRVMPQTKEAINHALNAGVPIIVALNKIDKPHANPDKIREELANENILVEDWGGKYQCQEVSAKSGLGINELLEKVLIEAELMALKADPARDAVGTVVEASLDKGRGYVATILVQKGTLRVGDIMVAGVNHGRVRAMIDHKGRKLTEVGPSMPAQILGLDGAPQAGDKIQVCETEREAREITNKRSQLLREQNIRTKKHLTLDEIGRRLAIGNFRELNLIIKADVDGSVEALTDSLLKLSTGEVQVNVIHKAVGQITESDVLLASASDAIIVGFQVRPSGGARKIAENEQIEIKTYSVIYKAIEEIKDALEGLLAPTVEEIILGNIEVRDVFKITKVGTVAGCYVTEGLIKRNNQIRLIREGIVVHTGEISALKRYKDDVSEVKFGYECGLSIKNFNDIQVGDTIEAFEERETKRKL